MTDIIELFEKQVFEIYSKENLIALQDNEYSFGGVNVLEMTSISRKFSHLDSSFNTMKNTWDIIICNSDLRYFTALLYLYRPFINNPFDEMVHYDGRTIFTYFQNMYDHRYSQFASICFEKLYNYCDRIGDLLANCHQDKFRDPKKIFFPLVVDKLKLDINIKNDTFFGEILTYRDNVYKGHNEIRKEVVHYHQFETNYRYDFTMNSTNKEEITKLWDFKYGLPEYFKEQLDRSNHLFLNTFNFLSK